MTSNTQVNKMAQMLLNTIVLLSLNEHLKRGSQGYLLTFYFVKS